MDWRHSSPPLQTCNRSDGENKRDYPSIASLLTRRAGKHVIRLAIHVALAVSVGHRGPRRVDAVVCGEAARPFVESGGEARDDLGKALEHTDRSRAAAVEVVLVALRLEEGLCGGLPAI